MKKILTLVISAVIVAALAIGIIVVVVNHQNEQKHTLTVSTMYGGTLELSIDNANYSIESDEAQSFSVKKKSNISIKAVADDTHAFVSWELNGSTHSKEAEIKLTVDKDSELHAKFQTKFITATVKEGDEGKEVQIDMSKNLLAQLNTAFNATDWYSYSFKIGETAVTDTTKITTATEITAVKEAKDFTVTFKYGDETIATRTYNYNKLTVENPAFPSSEDFAELKYYENFAWNYKIPATTEKPANIEATLTKTAIQYPITFKLQDGYTFDDETTEVSTTYSYNEADPTSPVIANTPDLSEIETAQEHYNLTWVLDGVTYTYNKETAVEVNSTVEATKYYITFKHEGNVVAKEAYSIEDATITVPELPEKEHYTVTWSNYTLNVFDDQEVNTVLTPIEYTVSFSLPAGYKYVVSEGNSGNVINRTYTIENTKVTAPTAEQIPEIKHYTKEWNSYDLSKGGNITVTLKEVVYSVTYKLDDSISSYYTQSPIVKNYTISAVRQLENQTDEAYRNSIVSNLTPRNGYKLVWEGSITVDTLDNKTIILKEEMITYTATFIHNGEDYAVKEFTIENYASFAVATAPEFKTGDSHVYKWEPFAIDGNKLENITINSIKLAAVSVEYKYDNGIYTTNNNFGYFSLFVQIDEEGNVVKDGEDVVIYTTESSNSNIAKVDTTLIETIKSAICSIEDSKVFAVPVKVELFNSEEQSQGGHEFDKVEELQDKLNDLLSDCKTTGYYIEVSFE